VTTHKVQRRDVNAASRLQVALKLRLSGLSYDEVARQAGYADRGAAFHAIQRELGRCIPENIEAYRAEELAIINAMHAECWEMFMNKKNKMRLFAADRLIALSERRCRLLGLNVESDGGAATAQVIIRESIPNYFGEPIASATPVLPSPTSEVSE